MKFKIVGIFIIYIITLSSFTISAGEFQFDELKNEEMFSAIGWLSRENKIKLSYKDKQLLFSLI